MGVLQSKAKAAFDASSHLTNVVSVDFRLFLQAQVKNCEALVVELTNLQIFMANPGGASKVATGANASGTQQALTADELSKWADVNRSCAVAVAHTIADLADHAIDHGKLANLDVDHHTIYLLVDGSRPLTGNWDAGSFRITAETLASDIATGTAPLTVASTSVVTNLNADLVDGKHVSELSAALRRNPINLITVDTTIGVSYDWIRVDSTSGPVVITLQLASALPGKTFDITNIGTGIVTVKAAGSDTINGDATQILDSQHNSITIVSEGSNWGII